MSLKRIAHDVAVESGMSHESLSALTAVVQEGIDRARVMNGVHRMSDLTRDTAELRALIEKRAWTHEDDYRVRQLVPALLDLADEVERAKELVSDLEPVPLSAEPDGMETTAAEEAWNTGFSNGYTEAFELYGGRAAKAREEEREACELVALRARDRAITNPGRAEADLIAAAIRARTAPDPQSEIGLRAYLADLAARRLKP